MQLNILYQDPWLVAIDKPAGLLVHRTALARREKYFAMQLLRDQLGGEHVFPLHRLDRPTSGVLLFARSSSAAAVMAKLLEQGGIDKRYLAVVRGYAPPDGDLDYPLKEELDKIADALVDPDKPAQPAQTRFRRLATTELPVPVGRYPSARYSLLEVQPLTGRKHQIRRHMHHLSYPIVGDTTHGDGRHNRLFRDHLDSQRLLLIARRLRFTHPWSSQEVTITAPLCESVSDLFTRLGFPGDEASMGEALATDWPSPLTVLN